MHTITRHTRAPAARRAAAAPVAPPSPRRALFRRPAQAGQPHGQPQQQPKGEERRLGWAEQDLATGLEFRPAEAVKDTLSDLFNREKQADASLARLDYSDKLESAVNEQINIEYNLSYLYHSMFAYFDRDNVGMTGFAAYFYKLSGDERDHAHKLMTHQNVRGGRVALGTLTAPPAQGFGGSGEAKDDVLGASELALSLEKLNFSKLRALRDLAEEVGDTEWQHFIDDYMLDDQARDVKRVATLVSQLRRVGAGHGTWDIDRQLYDKYGSASAGGTEPL